MHKDIPGSDNFLLVAPTATLQCIRHICVVVNVYRWQYSEYISIKRYYLIVSFQVCESLICYLLENVP